MKKRFWILVFIALWGLLGLIVSTCVTFPSRNDVFENQMRSFANKKIPGSEFTLFNGEDLSGWSVHGIGKWTVHDGVLTVRRGVGYLATCTDQFSDFILSLQARVEKRGNSGAFFRSHAPGWGLRPWPIGYEAQIDNHDPQNPTGSLYDRVTATQLLTKDGEWFDMEISAIGPSLQVRVNGIVVMKCSDTSFTRGFIALQAHGPFSRVEFKNIRIRIP